MPGYWRAAMDKQTPGSPAWRHAARQLLEIDEAGRAELRRHTRDWKAQSAAINLILKTSPGEL